MRRWQKILFAVLLLLLLSQLPFAYRRRRLARLHETIQQLNAQRKNVTADSSFREYKGVVHVHSFLGGHSSGNFQDIIDAARTNQLDFVVMTEHTERDINTAAMTLQGINSGVLFLSGNEVSVNNAGRVFLVPGLDSPSDVQLPLETLTTLMKSKQGLTVIAYPTEFVSWEKNEADAVEIYNLYSNAQHINPFVMFFDGLWSYHSYPDLLFANFYDRPDENLRLWDQALEKGKRLTALAGNDAHANVGFGLHDSSGKTLVGLQLDPYERSFRLFRLHALIPQGEPWNSASLLKVIRAGHCFIGFDLFADTTGFRFEGASRHQTSVQGDELKLQDGEARLKVTAPLPGRVVLFKNGQPVDEQQGKEQAEFVIKQPGVYRCEVYLPQLPHPVSEQPWIISNPIYVR